jgi:DNA polymerase-3 subunit epsilon
MPLVLTKPLVFLDLETTGINIASDRIVEISILKLHPDGAQQTLTRRINPEMPIPAEATRVHGITNEDVANMPTFKQVAREIANLIDNSDLAGYNSNKFDIPLLGEEFLRADVDIDVKARKWIDVQNIFHKKEQRTLGAAYKFYCDKNLENAHNAEADTMATYEVLMAQLSRYEDLKNDVNFLHEFSGRTNSVDLAGRIVWNEKKIAVFNFGKHKDKPVTEIFEKEPSYFDWMMKGDFPLHTKKVLTAIRLGSLREE